MHEENRKIYALHFLVLHAVLSCSIRVAVVVKIEAKKNSRLKNLLL